MINPNLAAVTAQIGQMGMNKGGMPTLPSSPVAQQQKQKQYAKGTPPKAGQKMENGLDIEMRFIEGYKKHKGGAEPYAQYANVKMPDGTTKRVLAYDLGGGKNYIPQIHGPDYAFQSRDLLDKIPSVMDVVNGFFKPPRGEDPANIATTANDASRLDTNYAAPRDPLLAQFAQSAPQMSAKEMSPGEPVAATPIEPGSTPQPAPVPLTAQQRYEEALKNSKVNPKYAEGNNKITEAQAMANKVLRPDVTLQSAIPLLLTALFAGENGADIFRGGVQGINQATGMRQTESDIQTQAARNKLMAEGQGIQKIAAEEDQIRNANINGLAALAGQESRVDLQQLRNDVQKQRIEATLRGQDMTRVNKMMSGTPAQRAQAALEMGLSIEDAQAWSAYSPAEQARLASANLSNVKADDLKSTLPSRLAKMQSATNLENVLVELTGLRKEGQATRNAIDVKELNWFDLGMRTKINNIEAQTNKANADAQKSEREMFYSDGSPKSFGKGGMTDTSYTTNWKSFKTAIDKADAEIVSKTALVTKMRDSITQLEKESKESAAKNPIMGADPGLAKKIQKIRDSIDLTESEMKGLQVTIDRNKANIATLEEMKTGGGIPGGAGGKGVGSGGKVHKDVQWFIDNGSKMTPEEQEKYIDSLVKRGLAKRKVGS